MNVKNQKNLKFPKNNGGPLYYFGNRNLTLPDLNGHLNVDSKWLEESFSIISENMQGKRFNRCFEPFAGSAAWSLTAMELGFSKEYYINDGNKTLIDFLRLAKERPNKLKEAYIFLVDQYNKSNQEAFFIKTIEDYNNGNDDTKSLLISFIINHSWGGMVFHKENGSIIYRGHPIKGLSVPGCLERATLTVTQYCNEIDRVSELLNDNVVHFQNGDFREAITNIDVDDFIILNPPYPENERSLTEKFGLYFEISPHEVLHKEICSVIELLESQNIAYFMSYGLHNQNLKKFRIHTSANKSYYLRLIGSDACIFGKALDQTYFKKGFSIPSHLKYKIIAANEVLQDRDICHKEALEVFTQLST